MSRTAKILVIISLLLLLIGGIVYAYLPTSRETSIPLTITHTLYSTLTEESPNVITVERTSITAYSTSMIVTVARYTGEDFLEEETRGPEVQNPIFRYRLHVGELTPGDVILIKVIRAYPRQLYIGILEMKEAGGSRRVFAVMVPEGQTGDYIFNVEKQREYIVRTSDYYMYRLLPDPPLEIYILRGSLTARTSTIVEKETSTEIIAHSKIVTTTSQTTTWTTTMIRIGRPSWIVAPWILGAILLIAAVSLAIKGKMKPRWPKYCPNCDTANPLDAEYCIECGTRL